MASSENLFEIGEDAIAVKSNWLRYGGKLLKADVLDNFAPEKRSVSSEQLGQMLLLGRFAILKAITDLNYPGAQTTPNILTIQLGSVEHSQGMPNAIFTQKGYDNGGIIQHIDEILPDFHEYWMAIREAGFLPKVFRTSGKKDGGAWMVLGKPTLEQAIDQWIGEIYSREMLVLRANLISNPDYKDSLSRAEKEELLNNVSSAQESIAQMSKNYNVAEIIGVPPDAVEQYRTKSQINLLFSQIKLKEMLDFDRDTIDEDTDDALQYARQMLSGINDSAVRAIENALY